MALTRTTNAMKESIITRSRVKEEISKSAAVKKGQKQQLKSNLKVAGKKKVGMVPQPHDVY